MEDSASSPNDEDQSSGSSQDGGTTDSSFDPGMSDPCGSLDIVAMSASSAPLAVSGVAQHGSFSDMAQYTVAFAAAAAQNQHPAAGGSISDSELLNLEGLSGLSMRSPRAPAPQNQNTGSVPPSPTSTAGAQEAEPAGRNLLHDTEGTRAVQEPVARGAAATWAEQCTAYANASDAAPVVSASHQPGAGDGVR